MADEQHQDKHLEPTERKKQQAREKGQVPRSRDLNTAMIMLAGTVMLMFFSQHLMDCLTSNMKLAFTQAYNQSQDLSSIGDTARLFLTKTLIAIAPFFITVFIFALAGPAMISGIRFAPKAMGFKFERISPLKGIKRIVSLHSLMEVVKSLLKFLVILSVAGCILHLMLHKLLSLGHVSVEQGVQGSFSILRFAIITLSASLLLFAAIDVPFQMWENKRKLKMSQQEMKDEMKETEGNPEMKQFVKRRQQHIARQRMIIELPKATIVITNPEHYAVALKYDKGTQAAPIVVAKGVDWMAEHIKQLAKQHNVPILSAPPLARSIYFNSELFEEIPGGLYQAVAKVLAYVYQLRAYQVGAAPQPVTPENIDIPVELRRDQHGKHETTH